MKEFYVYIYLDPRKPGKWTFENAIFDFEPFYVGKGKGRRINHHLKPCELKRNTYKSNKIKLFIKNGLEPIRFKAFENLDVDSANLIEIKMIKHFGRIDLKTGILTNQTSGGDGAKGTICSPETRLKKSLAAKGKLAGEKNPMFGMVNELHPRFGTKHTPETIQKIKDSEKVAHKGEENPRYDKTIYTFYNTISGEEFTGTRFDLYTKYNLCDSAIGDMVRRKEGKISVKGWTMDNERFASRYEKKNIITKKIFQFDKNNEQLINIFNSAKDAGKKLNFPPKKYRKIYSICNGQRPSLYGFKWKYEENLTALEKERVKTFIHNLESQQLLGNAVTDFHPESNSEISLSPS